MVTLGGEIRDALELRHLLKCPVQAEAPSVIAAAQMTRLPALLRDDIAAMRADVREAVQPVLHVPREQERLVQAAFQQRQRMYLPRNLHLLDIAHEMPGT